MFITNIFIGLILIVLGVIGLKYNYQIVGMFGRNNVFERRLGAGTTYPAFQLGAIIVILSGMMVMFSIHDNVLNFLLGPLISVFESSQN